MWAGVTAFAVTAAYWPGIYGAGSAPRMACLAVLVTAALLFIRVRMTAVHWAFLGLLLYSAITGLWGLVTTEWAWGMWWLILMFASFCLGHETEDSGPMYMGAALGLVPSAVAVVFQMSGNWSWDQVAPPSGLFVNRNFMAEAAALSVIAIAHSRRWTVLTVPAFCLLMAKSKGAFLAVAVAGVLWVWRRSRIAALGLCVLFLCAAAVLIPNALSVEIRTQVWADGIRGLSFFGAGIGEYFSTVPSHSTNLNAAFARVEYAHNEYLHFAYEIGVGSVLLWAVFIAALQGELESERLVLVGALVMSFFSFPLHLPATGFVAFFVAGRLCRGRPVVGFFANVRGDFVQSGEKPAGLETHVREDGRGGGPVSIRSPSA